jgi:hypothetical protein
MLALRQKQETAYRVETDLQMTISARKAVTQEILTWAERFDL